MADKILGVIGGLGPLATAYFLELVTKMTDAKCDQDHIEVLIHSKPSIPDRTKYLLGESRDNPFGDILQIGKNLQAMGAGCIAIPCMTAHYFYDLLDQWFPCTVINGVRETVLTLKEQGYKRIGIMATTGTIRAGLFQKELEHHNMEAIIPDDHFQWATMSLIYDDVKAGRKPDLALFNLVGNHLEDKGAEAIILGCTELSFIKRDCLIGPGYIDALEVLAKACVTACGAPLKEDYKTLISGLQKH